MLNKSGKKKWKKRCTSSRPEIVDLSPLYNKFRIDNNGHIINQHTMWEEEDHSKIPLYYKIILPYTVFKERV